MAQPLGAQTAIVTGGSGGYGTGIAKALQEKGAKVWITGRNEDSLVEVSRMLGVQYVRADISNTGDWDRLIASVLKEDGRIDILVNNAGGGIKIAPLDEQSDEEIKMSIAVNLTGAVLGCKRVIPSMKKQKSGTIVNVSSVCARQAWPAWSVYSAAKAGLVQFSNSLYTELREFGIRVTTVIPSWGATNFLVTAHLNDFDSKTKAKTIKPAELGDLISTICALPSHLNVQDITLWPLVQKVEPL